MANWYFLLIQIILFQYDSGSRTMGKLFSIFPKTNRIKSTKTFDLCEKGKTSEGKLSHFESPFCKWKGHSFFVGFSLIEPKHRKAQSTFIMATVSRRKLLLTGFTMEHPDDSVSSQDRPYIEETVGCPSVVRWTSPDGNINIYKQFTVSRRHTSSKSGIKCLKL